MLSNILGCFLLLNVFSVRSDNCPWNIPDLKPWSDPTTWDSGSIPSKGSSFDITQKILLDTQTESLGTVRLINGGMIVFSPDHQVKLIADNVLIMNNGSLIIGTPDCIYSSDTEIELTGEEGGMDTSFGYYTKGIYVDVGGNLDIHGQDKLSWTKLTETLTPIKPSSVSR